MTSDAMIPDQMVEAAARSDAEFDKRGWLEMPKHERGRYLARARKSLTVANAAAWRPIESAPRDGTRILVCGGTYIDSAETFPEERPLEGSELARWDDCQSAWQGECSNVYDEFYYYKPTHWMPRPAPPQQEGE